MGGEENEEISRYAYLTEMDVHPGDDCFAKALMVGAKGAAIGAIYGTVAAAVAENTSALPAVFSALKLIGSHATFVGTVGAVFATTACLSTSLRGKDDFKNWGYGGMAAGTVVGLRFRHVPVGVGMSVAMGALMAAIKFTEVYKDPFPSRTPPNLGLGMPVYERKE